MPNPGFTPIDHYTEMDWPTRLEHRHRVELGVLAGALGARDGALLDVGCGDGFLLAELDRAQDLTARGWALHGIDVSPTAVALAQARPYQFSVVNAEDGLPFTDGALDVVAAAEVIEHVYDPDSLLDEIRRVLRPGGSVVITTPNPQAWYNRALFLVGSQPLFFEASTRSTLIGAGRWARLKRQSQPVGHIRLFNRRALTDLLEASGFRVAELRGSIFEALPAPVQRIDLVCARRPSLASGFVVRAVKA